MHDATSMIECKISCPRCGMNRQDFLVRVRKNGEPIEDYLSSAVLLAAFMKHAVVSPACQATELANLMIPIDEHNGIGFNPDKKLP